MQVAEQEHRGTAVSRWSMSCMLSGVSWPRCGDQGAWPISRLRGDATIGLNKAKQRMRGGDTSISAQNRRGQLDRTISRLTRAIRQKKEYDIVINSVTSLVRVLLQMCACGAAAHLVLVACLD
jgi:hypothetical protein